MKELCGGLHGTMQRTREDGKPNKCPYPSLLEYRVGAAFPENVMSKIRDAIMHAITMGFVIGSKVTRTAPSAEVGEVIGYNTSDGLYNGDRYPIVVKFESGVFEYGVESLDLKEVPEDFMYTPYCIHQIQDHVRVQGDISGDKERAYELPFKQRGQFDNSKEIPEKIGDRFFGYIWAENMETAIGIAKSIITNS